MKDLLKIEQPIERMEIDYEKKFENKTDEELLQNLNEILNDFRPYKNYTVHGDAPELHVCLDIEIKNFGPIVFPLNDSQVEDLIKVCELKTDSTYQIEPNKIKIKNPDWDLKLQILVDRVTTQLGGLNICEARLEKFLMLRTGGHQLKNRDQENEENIFASLVVFLPSEYTGGEFVVYEQEKKSKQIIDPKNSTVQFLAYFSDLEHELKEVKSGHRLALIYSIRWVKERVPIDHRTDDYVEKIVQIFNNFKSQDYRVGLTLDHFYSESSFASRGTNGLKGIDFQRFDLLQKASSLLPKDKHLNFYIAHACHITHAIDVSGSNLYHDSDDSVHELSFNENDYKWDILDEDFTINDCYDSNGNSIRNLHDFHQRKKSFFYFESLSNVINPSTSETNIDRENPNNWRGYKDLIFKGTTGKSSPTLTTTCHKYFLVFWTKAHALQTALEVDPNYAANLLYDSIESIDFNQMFEFSKRLKEYFYINPDSWRKIFKILVKINDLRLTRSFVSGISYLEVEFVKDLALVVQNFGFGSVEDALIEIIELKAKNIPFCCALVKALFGLNLKEEAFSLFKESLIPILNKENKSKTTPILNKDMVETLSLFLEKDASFKALHHELSKSVIERIEFLRQKLSKKPGLTWCMPNAEFPRHPKVEEFFHGNDLEFEYKDITKKNKAIDFIARYGAYQRGYSCDMDLIGTKTEPIIKIVKTRNVFKKVDNEFKSYEIELEKLLS